MRATSDLPRRPPSRLRGRLGLLAVAALLLFLALSVRGLAEFYTDYLWFQGLRLNSIWATVLRTKFLLGLLFTFAFFSLLWVNLVIAERIAPGFRPAGPEEEIVERYHQVVGPHANRVRVGVAALFALIAGPGAASQWSAWIQFRNSVPFGAKDPQFHRDVGFYVFQLPFMRYVVDWSFAALLIVLVVTAVAHYLNGGIRVQTPFQKVTPQVKAHLSVILGLLALLKAVGYWLQRFELVFSQRGVVQGASYTDVKAQLPALRLLIFIALAAAVLFLVNIWRRGWVLPVIAVGLWAFVSVVVGAAYPAYIQKFVVDPTESVKERPYIQRNIAATRTAFGLEKVKVNDFPFEATKLTAEKLAENAETIRNVRLWDPETLKLSYERLQEVRTFYRFNEVDIDRYQIDGRTTQVLLSARELNAGGITSPSWVNRHLVFTHGYGAVAAPANAVAPNGRPDLLLKDLPPQGSPELTQPAIYYGENLSGFAIVKTKQNELDYSDAKGTDHTTRYTGNGGVRMGSFLRRLAFASRFGDVNALISGFVTPDSRVLYIRDIKERVRKAAPFLHYDSDPYPVIIQGKVKWIQDAYTATSRYPYSQAARVDRVPDGSGLQSDFNYVRNSVKVVVDAYDGSMKFYVVDKRDPIVQSYQKAFPRLFTDASQIDPEVERHFRYPEDLFRVQSDMFGLYHITNPGAFYKKADVWDPAQHPGDLGQTSVGAGRTAGQSGIPGLLTTRERRMDPYYLLMRLPDEKTEDFLILQNFVPTSRDDSRKELSAFLIAKSDPGRYGELEAFVMPRERQVDGPAQVGARINQEPTISEKLTLLNQPGSGSKARPGNLLVLPIGQSLLYIRPLYVEAEQTPVPELKNVIVVYGDRVVMRESLRAALEAIFGAAPPTLEQQPAGGAAPGGGATPGPPPGPGTGPATGTLGPEARALLQQAQTEYNSAQEALKRGDLAAYQSAINRMNDLVGRALGSAGVAPPPAAGAGGGTPPPTTTPASTTSTASA